MRLTIKLVVWFIVCVVLAVGVNGYLAVRTALERYEKDLAAHHLVMGRVLREAFSEVMDTDGEERAVSMLSYTDKRVRVNIRWVHLEGIEPGVVSAQRLPTAPRPKLDPLLVNREVHYTHDAKLWSYVPMHLPNRGVSALEFSEPLDGERVVVREAILHEVRALGGVVLSTGIATVILGIFLVARPIRRLVEHARRVGTGDLSPVSPAAGRDEIALLAKEMNTMTKQLSEAQNAKLKALEQLRHAERLSTVGKLASGLAHELGTPLNVITLRANAIAKGRASGAKATDAATSIAEQATRMTNLVRQLLDFARRKTTLARADVNVRVLVDRTTNLLKPIAVKAKTPIRVVVPNEEKDGELVVSGDGGQLEQVLTNLLMNAIQAIRANSPESDGGASPPSGKSPAGSQILVTIDSAKEFARIRVEDAGIGMAADVVPHIFEPFFTTKPVGEGTGLGLAVCYGIVHDHGGSIEVDSALGKGTTMTVLLPIGGSKK